MEATEGTNREGHRGLAGVAYCRRAGTITQEQSPLAKGFSWQRIAIAAEVFVSNARLGA